jgi:hypothetical protein
MSHGRMPGRELDQPAFRERHAGAVADDDVIQEAYVHERQRFLL